MVGLWLTPFLQEMKNQLNPREEPAKPHLRCATSQTTLILC